MNVWKTILLLALRRMLLFVITLYQDSAAHVSRATNLVMIIYVKVKIIIIYVCPFRLKKLFLKQMFFADETTKSVGTNHTINTHKI